MVDEIDPKIAVATFLKRGGEGRKTKLFENLSPDKRESVLKSLGPDLRGVPIIAFVEDDANWLLITTLSVTISEAGEIKHIAIIDLKYVDCDMEGFAKKGIHKDQWNELTIVSVDESRNVVRLEPGSSFFGVWNSLQWICHRAGTMQSEA